MKKQNPNRIAELRAAKKLSQRELAERLSAHWVTISKLERGDMKLTQDWMERLAPPLGVSAAELLADSSLIRSVYVSGFIEPNGRRGEQKYPEDSDQTVDFKIDLGVTSPNTSLWYLVHPPFFGTIAQHASMVRFTYIEGETIDNFIDHVCLVDLAQEGEIIVGLIHRGKAAGYYDLTLPNGGRARNVQPTSFAPLSLLLPIPLLTPGNLESLEDLPPWGS